MKVWLLDARKSLLILLYLLLLSLSPILYASTLSRGIHAVSKQGKQIYLYENYHALVIGISNYDWWPKLPYATRDAKQVAERLKLMGYQVKLVLDPTSRQLKAALNDMVYAMGMVKDRALLLYYAGHGETETLADATKMGYIIPKDCPLLKKDPMGFTSHAISMRDIESVSLRIRSKHVLMIFDSCFSGSLFSLVRAVPEDVAKKSSLPVRQYITAGREDEQVPDKSIFKRIFLVGLEGDADLTNDGYITGSELGMYLSVKVINCTRGRQHPQYGKINNPNLDRGDFIFMPVKQEQITKPDSKIQKAGQKTSGPNVAMVERKTEVTNLEITFWESIKDSKDCEMFAVYLTKFPEGFFSDLARIHMRKLACENSLRDMSIDEHEGELQTSAVAPLDDSLRYDSRIKLAILPWYFSAPANEHSWFIDRVESTASAVSETILDSESFVLTYSYYDLGNNFKAKKIDRSIIDDTIVKELWASKDIFSDHKPNIDLVCEIGRELKVDEIVMYALRLNRNWSTDIRFYLVNVDKKQVYSEACNIRRYASFDEEVLVWIKKFFIAYNKVDAQTVTSLGPKYNLESSSELSLAILPWYLGSTLGFRKNMMIEALSEIFGSQYKVKPFYSHYDLGKRVETQPINKRILTNEMIDDLWLSKGRAGIRHPNLYLIRGFGNELSLDKILTFKIMRGNWGNEVTIYLIDVKSGELYQHTWEAGSNDGVAQFKQEIEEFLEKFLTS